MAVDILEIHLTARNCSRAIGEVETPICELNLPAVGAGIAPGDGASTAARNGVNNVVVVTAFAGSVAVPNEVKVGSSVSDSILRRITGAVAKVPRSLRSTEA